MASASVLGAAGELDKLHSELAHAHGRIKAMRRSVQAGETSGIRLRRAQSRDDEVRDLCGRPIKKDASLYEAGRRCCRLDVPLLVLERRQDTIDGVECVYGVCQRETRSKGQTSNAHFEKTATAG